MHDHRCYFLMTALLLPVSLLTSCRGSEPSAQPEAPTAIELSYRILKTQRNVMLAVPEDHEFSSGNQMRIAMRINLDASIYVFATGRGDDIEVLHPDPQTDANRARFPANQENAVPVKGFFVFDARPGTVELVVIASRSPLDALERSIRGNRLPESAWEDLVAPRLARAAESPPVVHRITGSPQRARDAPWNTVTAPLDQADGCLIHRIRLTHRR